jgi:hypothetical protein
MANMVCIWIEEIWRRLALSHSDLSEQMTLAKKAAADTDASLLDCPWNFATDSWSRAMRVTWRVIFRGERDRLRTEELPNAQQRVPLVNTAERIAA